MRILNRNTHGEFTRPTLAGTFGLGNKVCTCGGMNPWKVGIEPEPDKCGHCGKTLPGSLIHEYVPDLMNAGDCLICGHVKDSPMHEISQEREPDGCLPARQGPQTTAPPPDSEAAGERTVIHGEIWGVGRKGCVE